MKLTHLLSAVLMLAMVSIVRAEEPKSSKLPASLATATDVLKISPRHGEWVEVPMGETKIKTFVVYPEVKEKAPVVIVIHEIFGMSDWVRSVADQLAAEGFIAVAPDLLSGMGPGGGGTESLGEGVRDAIRKLTPDDQGNRPAGRGGNHLRFPPPNGRTPVIGSC